MYKSRVIIGGTFAYLHKGHEALLRKAFSSGDFVYIGLTTDRYVKKSKGRAEESYSKRKRALKKFVFRFRKGFAIMPLEDRYGPSLKGDFKSMVVSQETYAVAKAINKLRKKKGLKQLKIIKVSFVKAYDGRPISSRRILGKEIDRKGQKIKQL